MSEEILPKKVCPFCKEKIHEDALKCRYCQSVLLPITTSQLPQPDDGNRVTYILDRDLIRFAKFSGSVVAIFLVIGAYLFGFKLESALEKVRTTQDDLTKSQMMLVEAQRDLEAAQNTVNKLKSDVKFTLGEANSILNEIKSQKDVAYAIVYSIRDLDQTEFSNLQLGKSEKLDKIRGGTKTKFWASGTTIRIKFLDGDLKAQKEVMAFCQEWLKFTNIKFKFVASGDSEVRVSFKAPGAWSYLGTDALAVSKDLPTINFQWVDQRIVLHEFGHVLGLVEEHLNPKAEINWNKDQIFKSLSGPPNYWDRAQIEVQLFRKFSSEQLGEYREFDPQSIMTMRLDKEWTGGLILGDSEKLSESDKALIARIYP